MARTFNGANYGRNTNGPLAAYPISMACLVRTTNATASLRDPFFLGHTSTGLLYLGLQIGTTHLPVYSLYSTTAGMTITGTTVVNTGAWFLLAIVSASATDHRLYVNGVQEGSTDTTSVAFPAVNCATVGVLEYGGSFIQYFIGDVARPTIWNEALSAPELVAMAQKRNPREFRPRAIVFAPPLFGLESPEPDYSRNRFDLTLTGSPTKANDPPITLFTRRQPFGWVEEAVGGSTLLPKMMQHGLFVGAGAHGA